MICFFYFSNFLFSFLGYYPCIWKSSGNIALVLFISFGLTCVMHMLLFRYEFKANHEEWVKSVKPKLAPDVSNHVLAAINTKYENIKMLYKVRTEMRACLQSLLKVS